MLDGELSLQPRSVAAIAPGEFLDYAWGGLLYRVGRENGCSCHTSYPAPIGWHHFEIAVYPTESYARRGACASLHTLEINLPVSDEIVTVQLQPGSPLCE